MDVPDKHPPTLGVVAIIQLIPPIPTRFADVNTVLRDARFSADRLRAHIFRENFDRTPVFLRQQAATSRSMLVMDPPDHTRLRRLVNKAFTHRRIAMRENRIESIVSELLDAAESRGSLELMSDFAAPLPAIAIAELLGVPPEERDQFKAWSTVLIASLGNRTTTDVVPESETALKALFSYLEGIIVQRRREPRDDLISAMVLAQEENDALSDAELLATTNLSLLAGLETTTNLIGNGLLALLRDPEAFEALRANDALCVLRMQTGQSWSPACVAGQRLRCFLPDVPMVKGRKHSFRVTRGNPTTFAPEAGRPSTSRHPGASRRRVWTRSAL